VRIGLLAIGGWLVAAALAVGISWSAISVVRDSVGASQPVATALPAPSEASTPAPGPSSTRPTAAPTVGALVVKAGQGGTVTAQCANGRPHISAVPRQGFRAEFDDSGAEVQFRSSDHRTEMKVSCSGLTATVQVEEHSGSGGGGGGGGGGDDNGGDNHGGGSGGSGGGSGRSGGGGG
jgi:hypothetical protein